MPTTVRLSGVRRGGAEEEARRVNAEVSVKAGRREWIALDVLALRTLAAVLAIGLLWPPHLVLAQGAFRGARS